MAINEFVARNGLIAQNDSQITGSLIVTDGITGSFLGNLAGTASYANNAELLDGLDLSNFTLSSSFNSYTSSLNSYTQSLNAATGAFVQNSQTGSYATKTEVNAFTASINSYTSSLNAATSSFVRNNQTSSFIQNSQTGSFATFTALNAYTSSINSYTSSLNSATSSFVRNNQTSSFVQNSQTGSFATFTALNAYTSSINSYTQSLNAATSSFVLNSQTSSFVQNSQTGAFATKTEVNSFTASINSYTQSLNAATSSFVLNSQTSSFVQNSQTSSFVQNSQTSSFVQNSQTGSFATFTALNAYTSSTNAFTASINSYTASNNTTNTTQNNRIAGLESYTSSLNTATSSFVRNNQTSSFVQNSQTSSMSVLSSSYAATASFAGNFTVASTLTAQTLVVQTVSSSIIYSSGSNTFGNSLANNQVLTGSVIVTGSLSVNGSNAVLVNQTSSFATFTALNAYTSSINSYTQSLNNRTSSFATTGSNTFNGNQIITGSLAVGTGSIGNGENTLVVGPAPNGGSGEGGQILLSAVGGTFNSASMLDNYQNKFRVLKGTNAGGSDSYRLQVDLHSGQIQIPTYTGTGAFPGTAAANLAVDSSGNVITVAPGGGGGGTTDTGSLATTGSNLFRGDQRISGSLTVTSSIYQGAFGSNETQLTGYGLVVQGANSRLRVGPNYSTGGDRDYIDLIAGGLESKLTTNNENFIIENRESGYNISLVTSGSGNVNVTGSLRVTSSIFITTNTGTSLQTINGSTVGLFVSSSGASGFGTNVPRAIVHISGSSTLPMLRLEDPGANTDIDIQFVPATVANSYTLGVDDSDADRFKLTFSSSLGGTNDRIIVDTTGSVTIVTGSFNVASASFTYNQNLSVTTGSARVISQVATGSSRAAFFDYVITSGSNARAGTVFSVWSGSTVEWNDVSTNDIGNTTDVTVYAAITGSNVALLATSSINFTWAIKSLVRTI